MKTKKEVVALLDQKGQDQTPPSLADALSSAPKVGSNKGEAEVKVAGGQGTQTDTDTDYTSADQITKDLSQLDYAAKGDFNAIKSEFQTLLSTQGDPTMYKLYYDDFVRRWHLPESIMKKIPKPKGDQNG